MQDSYRILEYYAENFKKLRLVEFKPTGRMTVFTGKNGQGKTSALDAVPFVLGGKKHSPDQPTRKGAKSMKCFLDLGEFIVTRTEAGMTLTMAPGCKAWDTPQKMLDAIFDELAFDPMEFVRMKPFEQVEMLRKSLKLDDKLKQLDADNSTDFNERRIVNREVDRLTAEIGAIIVQPNLPKEKIDEAAIEKRISEAGSTNKEVIAQIEAKAKLATRVAEWRSAQEKHEQFLIHTEAKIPDLRDSANTLQAAIPTMQEVAAEFHASADKLSTITKDQGVISEVVVALHAIDRYARKIQEGYEDAARQWKQAEDALKAAQNHTAELVEAVNAARREWEEAPQGELLDTNTLMDELKQAQLINREIDKRTRAADLEKAKAAKVSESRALTRAMEGREEKKEAAIAGAKLPVDGLTFTEGDVLLDGVPLQQLGEAQQIKISIALVLARKPKLRLCLIKHGEALDEDSMAQLATMAEEMDFYIWMAKVDSTGKVGIFLEDGEIKTNNDDDDEGAAGVRSKKPEK